MHISPETHGELGWRPPTSFAFARDIVLQEIATAEIARVSDAMPVAFRKIEDRWQAVAVMGRLGGQNLHVTPDGRWRPGAVPPHALRLHPFWVDSQSRLILRPGVTAHPRSEQGVEPFCAGDALVSRLQQVSVFLRGLLAAAAPVDSVIATLHAAGMMARWSAPGEEAGIVSANLFCLDARRFARLPDAQVLALFRSGALRWLHAHLDSLRHADRFPAMESAARAEAVPAARPTGRMTETAAFIAAIAEDLGDAEPWDIISE